MAEIKDIFFVGLALQRLSDITCLEHGLSVIEKKKPSERVKRTTYPDKKSFRDDIIDAIDWILKEGSAKDFDELLYKLEDAGYEIKRGKHISLKGKDQKRLERMQDLPKRSLLQDFILRESLQFPIMRTTAGGGSRDAYPAEPPVSCIC